MTTKGWKYVEVSCQCGLTIEFYHWMDPSGFTLEHDETERAGSSYWGSHVLHHSETEEGMSGPIQTYLSYIDQMVVVREPARA